MAIAEFATTSDAVRNAVRNAETLRFDATPAQAIGTASAVSWGAIFAGAAGAAALSLILLILGTGLGLSAVSPWSQAGISATTFGVSTILWLALTQLLASGMGGYLAGRLRTKWVSVHTDEVYFRDTAHGFLAWAVASLATAALLTSTISALVGGGAQLGATVATSGGTVMAATGSARAIANNIASNLTNSVANPGAGIGPSDYLLDALFRADTAQGASASSGASNTGDATTAATAEAGRILANSLRSGALPAEDLRYLGQRVAQRTGLTAPGAERRVRDTYARLQTELRDTEAAARAAADKARKASAYAALWLFIGLLIGAFVASLCATFGGRQRDR